MYNFDIEKLSQIESCLFQSSRRLQSSLWVALWFCPNIHTKALPYHKDKENGRCRCREFEACRYIRLQDRIYIVFLLRNVTLSVCYKHTRTFTENYIIAIVMWKHLRL